MEKKITKRMILEAINANVENMNFEGMDVQAKDIVAYVERGISQLDAASATRAEKKKEASDEIKQAIVGVLTEEFQTKEAIAASVQVEEVAKVTARLSALVKEGIVKKEQIKVGDRRVMGYALA